MKLEIFMCICVHMWVCMYTHTHSGHTTSRATWLMSHMTTRLTHQCDEWVLMSESCAHDHTDEWVLMSESWWVSFDEWVLMSESWWVSLDEWVLMSESCAHDHKTHSSVWWVSLASVWWVSLVLMSESWWLSLAHMTTLMSESCGFTYIYMYFYINIHVHIYIHIYMTTRLTHHKTHSHWWVSLVVMYICI